MSGNHHNLDHVIDLERMMLVHLQQLNTAIALAKLDTVDWQEIRRRLQYMGHLADALLLLLPTP